MSLWSYGGSTGVNSASPDNDSSITLEVLKVLEPITWNINLHVIYLLAKMYNVMYIPDTFIFHLCFILRAIGDFNGVDIDGQIFGPDLPIL